MSTALGLVVANLQAVWASPTTCIPKRDSYRLVCDYQAVSAHIERSPGVMHLNEAQMEDLLGATCFGKLDLLLGYW